MTPRQVEELTPVEYAAFWRYAEDEAREAKRQERQARRHR